MILGCPKRTQNRSRNKCQKRLDFGPSWAPFWGAFWPPRWLKPVLEFLWERPRAVQDKFFWPRERPKSLPRAPQEPSKSCSRGLQELKRPQEGSKRPLGTDFDLSRPPRDPQINDFSGPQGNSLVPRACQEHSAKHPRPFRNILEQACFLKSILRYSETSRPGPPT